MDVRDLVDPAYREAMELAAARVADWSDPPAQRARAREAFPRCRSRTVSSRGPRGPGPAGEPTITVRLYRPAGASEPLPCAYWIHGGGYMGGAFDGNNEMASNWALELGCAVASVEYRLAPEHPYPAAVEDCYAGLQWLLGSAGSLGVDDSRVAIAGGSAGAASARRWRCSCATAASYS